MYFFPVSLEHLLLVIIKGGLYIGKSNLTFYRTNDKEGSRARKNDLDISRILVIIEGEPI